MFTIIYSSYKASLTVTAIYSISILNVHPIHLLLGILAIILLCLIGVFIYNTYKQKNKEIHNANEWMFHLLKSMPDMAIIMDADHVIINIINPLENVLLGINPKQLIGMNIGDIGKLNPAFTAAANIIVDNLEDTSITKKTNMFEYEVKMDGYIYYAAARTVPFIKGQLICFCHDDTEFVAAEKKSMELKSFFQSVVNNIPVGLLVKNISDDLRYVFFNNYLLDFHGNDAPFEIGQNDVDRQEEMLGTFLEEDMMVVNSGKTLSVERVSYNEETGLPERWSITTKNRFVGSDGIPYLMATTVETTETKKKDFELIKTQNELTLALEASKVSAWYFDIKQQTFRSLNGSTLSNDGLTLDDFINKAVREDRPKLSNMLNNLIAGRVEKEKLVTRIVVNNRIEWYETYAIGMKSEKNGKVYQLIGTERNITEDILKQKELEDAQSKLELAFNSAQIVPWELDLLTSKFSSINSDEIESQNISLNEYRCYIHPDDVRTLDEGFESILNGKKKMMRVEVRIAFPEAEQKWFELHAVISERDKDGHSIKMVGLRRDITAVKMTDELIELREKAERSNRLKSAFLANMSHEIRTPLNAIVGFSQLIMQTEDPEEKENFATIIETNNDLLLQLISDILDLSKIEANEMDFVFSSFEVATIFNHLELVYANKVKPGVKLLLDLPPQSCSILSERNRLTQVISNFLSNAIKFTTTGSITMGYSYTDNGLRFYVKDTGKGIDPENLPNVFTRFSKFDSFVQGTGLGLSISKHIIAYLEGEIGAESELGSGSEFWFTIPCEPIPIQ